MDATPASSVTSPRLQQAVVRVPISTMGTFDAELARLNRKAAKFGLEPITVKSSEDELYVARYRQDGDFVSMTLHRINEDDRKKFDETTAFVRLRRIELSYPVVKLGNWIVVGRVEPISPGANLIFTVTDDARDRAEAHTHLSSKLCCDHCKTSRQRNESYLLRNLDSPADDPQYMEIGRSCLKDFTGIDPAAALFLAKMGDFVRVDDFYDPEDPGNFSCRPTGTSMSAFLAHTYFCIEQWGYRSKKLAREDGGTSTADDAAALPSMLKRVEQIAQAWRERRDECYAVADKVMAWARSLDTQGNDYLHNVRALLANDDISFDGRHLAIAASAVQTWKREREKDLERQQAVANQLTTVGAEGEKMTRILRVVGHHVFSHDYGTGCYVHLRDEQGNHLTWKASQVPELIKEEFENREFHAQFKIKDHDEYQGIPQTNVTHLKVRGWVDEIGCELPEPPPKKKASRKMEATM